MQKYWLTFKDQKLEQQYQDSILHYQRDSIFKIASFSMLIVVAIKIIGFALQGNLVKLVSSVIVFTYLLFQYQVVKRKVKYLRLAAVILNHVAQIYQIWDNQTDSQMAMLQGINAMAFTTIVALVGEYIDGVITIINLTIYRIAWIFFQNSQINWSILLGQMFLIFFINYFNFQFHRGRRSSFLLTLVDSCSKTIFNKLAKDQPFLIIQYDEEKLQFGVVQENNCKMIYGQDLEFHDFMNTATISKKLLSQYLQEQYHQYQRSSNLSHNSVVFISYDKKKIKTDLSIYSGKQPQMLIVFEKIDTEKRFDKQVMTKKVHKLIKFLIKTTQLIKKLSKSQKNFFQIKSQFLHVKRKLFIIYLLDSFHLETKSIKINIQTLKQVFKKYCTGYKLFTNIIKEVQFETLPQTLFLFMLIVFDNSELSPINIFFNQREDETLEIQLQGIFEKHKIKTMIQPLRERLQVIFQSMNVTKNQISIKLNHEINIPFSIFSDNLFKFQ